MQHPPRTWDPERLREVVGDDREILLELVALFFDDTQARLRVLERSLVAGDHGTTRNEAHAIKGAAGNFGAERLHEFAKRLEEAARTGALPPARDLLARLQKLFSDLKAAVQQSGVAV